MELLKSFLQSAFTKAVVKYAKKGAMMDSLIMVISAGLFAYAWDYLVLTGADALAREKMTSIVINLTIFTLFIRLMPRAMDRLAEINFKEWWDSSSATDRAIYFSLRIAALSIATAMIITGA